MYQCRVSSVEFLLLSSIFFMFVSVIRVRPVWMSIGRGFVLMPVAVIFSVRLAREEVIMVAIVMPVPVLMGGSFMLMHV